MHTHARTAIVLVRVGRRRSAQCKSTHTAWNTHIHTHTQLNSHQHIHRINETACKTFIRFLPLRSYYWATRALHRLSFFGRIFGAFAELTFDNRRQRRRKCVYLDVCRRVDDLLLLRATPHHCCCIVAKRFNEFLKTWNAYISLIIASQRAMWRCLKKNLPNNPRHLEIPFLVFRAACTDVSCVHRDFVQFMLFEKPDHIRKMAMAYWLVDESSKLLPQLQLWIIQKYGNIEKSCEIGHLDRNTVQVD